MKAVPFAGALVMLSAVGCASTVQPRTTLTSAAVESRAADVWKVTTPPREATRADRHLDMYQRANELDRAGRCVEAKAAYTAYADQVAASDPRSADMAIYYSTLCNRRAVTDTTLDAVVSDVVNDRDRDALKIADEAVREGRASPWLYYHRAVALAGLRRTDEAVAAFETAEARLADDPWARALAVLGRARVLRDANRCDEARQAYEEYASLVHATDPVAADRALASASRCTRETGRTLRRPVK